MIFLFKTLRIMKLLAKECNRLLPPNLEGHLPGVGFEDRWLWPWPWPWMVCYWWVDAVCLLWVSLDVDECRLRRVRLSCSLPHQQCRNAVGSYMCAKMCPVGYRYDPARHYCHGIFHRTALPFKPGQIDAIDRLLWLCARRGSSLCFIGGGAVH